MLWRPFWDYDLIGFDLIDEVSFATQLCANMRLFMLGFEFHYKPQSSGFNRSSMRAHYFPLNSHMAIGKGKFWITFWKKQIFFTEQSSDRKSYRISTEQIDNDLTGTSSYFVEIRSVGLGMIENRILFE